MLRRIGDLIVEVEGAGTSFIVLGPRGRYLDVSLSKSDVAELIRVLASAVDTVPADVAVVLLRRVAASLRYASEEARTLARQAEELAAEAAGRADDPRGVAYVPDKLYRLLLADVKPLDYSESGYMVSARVAAERLSRGARALAERSQLLARAAATLQEIARLIETPLLPKEAAGAAASRRPEPA